MKVYVLRLGHRLVRDDRISTHLGLVARAFGANGMYLIGGEQQIKNRIDDVSESWGGMFKVELSEDRMDIIKKWKMNGGHVVHLTMYGIGVDEAIGEVRSSKKDLLVIVGAEKVPKEIYHVSDFNIAIGHQPHSEISALAIFLDRLFLSEELKRNFIQPRIRIVPTRNGKRVEMLDVEN